MSRLPVVQPDAVAATPPSEHGLTPVRYRVEGMDCGSCARTLERVVGELDGVRAVEVSFGSASMRTWGEVPEERVLTAVAAAGFRARPATRRAATTDGSFWVRDARAVSTLASIALLVVAVAVDLAGAEQVVAEPLYLLSMAVGGWAIARAALVGLRRLRLDMNVLMTLAAVGAVAIGSYAEAAWVLVLFSLGTTLETYALDRTRRSIQGLIELVPPTALVVGTDGSEREVPVADVAIGSTILIRPGDRLPLDGTVVDGSSAIDEAPITGESVPVDKTAGDRVFAGTLNHHGALQVRTTHDAAGSTIAQIVELVEQAQGTRAPSERLVDRFARVYTPLVFLAAVALAVVPILLGGEVDTWVYRGLALLIVACPCSLVISIPVAVVSAIGAAARRGVLIKGGEALEDLARVRVVALDKTGTLTAGEPQLEEILALTLPEDDALRLAATVERRSEHPLAGAIVRASRERGLEPGEPQRFLALPGLGLDALVDGRALWVGSPRLAEQRLGAPHPEIAGLQQRGRSVIALGEGATLLALFGLADAPRPGAAETVQALHDGGVERVVMLTGDTERVAAAVADAMGIDEYHAALLPADKLERVQVLEQETGAVGMVGDGINDAPALAAARVGVAMGAAGTGVALDAADVALLQDDLRRLPDVIALARRALGVMRQNVVASLVVKGVVVMLVPFGLVPLWLAVATDMGMSLLVTANALRLLRRDR